MDITENERLLLIQKKEEIRILTQEILDLVDKEVLSHQDITDVKKKLVHILSLLHILASYGSPNRDLHSIMMFVVQIIGLELEPEMVIILKAHLEIVCIVVNSINFSYSPWPSLFKAAIPPLASIEVKK